MIPYCKSNIKTVGPEPRMKSLQISLYAGIAKRALVSFYSGKSRDFSGNVTVDLLESAHPLSYGSSTGSPTILASVNFTRTDLTSGAADGDDGFVYKIVPGGPIKCPRGLDAR